MRLQEAVTRIAHSSSNSRTLGRVRLFLDGCFGGQLKFQFTHPGKGATGVPTTPAFRYRRFNSRTLGRVRRKTCLSISPKSPFQFTHPGKGATGGQGKSGGYPAFQFTHPGKGATHKPLVSAQRDVGFNSRTLGRVRQVGAEAAYLPLAFQFTHPGKGATLDNGSLTHDAAVSIHAPWEGCDSICSPR